MIRCLATCLPALAASIPHTYFELLVDSLEYMTRPPRARTEIKSGSSRSLKSWHVSQFVSTSRRFVNASQFKLETLEQFLCGVVQLRVAVFHVKPLAGEFDRAGPPVDSEQEQIATIQGLHRDEQKLTVSMRASRAQAPCAGRALSSWEVCMHSWRASELPRSLLRRPWPPVPA